MYTTTVGKTFLAEYNRRNNKNYTAQLFFKEVLHPLFFGHPKYMFWPQNSPFVQMKGGQKIHILSDEERQEKLLKLEEKIVNGDRDASIAITYPASEAKEFATTSGAITDMDTIIEEEDVYFSWIGGCLSLGVAGGYAILFNDADITYATFEGWSVYRRYLNDPATATLPPNKIVTWNGQWITFRLGKKYASDFDFIALKKQGFFDVKENEIITNTVAWSKLFFSLSHQYPNAVRIAYVFALGQTNKTIGFIPFQLQKGRRLHEIYQKLFGKEDFQANTQDFEGLFGKHIKRACELGNIGLQALEPKDLAKYFKDTSKNLNLKKTKVALKKGESTEDFENRKQKASSKEKQNLTTFQTYKTWLTAMISKNKQEVSDYTRDIANALVTYRGNARRTDRKNLIEKELFATKNKGKFIEALTNIVKDDSVKMEIIEKMNELRNYIHFLNNDEFSYFILLLKFDYAFAERNSNK